MISIETELNSHILDLQNEKLKLDSLNFVLIKQTKQIDSEKTQSNPSQNKLKKLFSKSLETSENIIFQQEKVDLQRVKIDSLKLILVQEYATSLDSLKKLPKSNFNENEIIKISEKYLLVSSKEHSLSFEIEKITNLLPSENELENAIFLNYLENSLKEVNEKIESITKTKDELEEITFLESATNEFLEEIDEQERLGVFSSQSAFENSFDQTSLENLGIDKSSLSSPPENSIFNLQIYSFHSLLNQLQIESSLGETITSENYVKILKRAKNKLIDYKEIILEKRTLFK
ncbi:MAG: hypothetical protein DWQ06_00245 [Calditrichaeota bacterium]|nr:MAG: hypothetical protein DWQ06_00245 [Calditrichota bacterium]